MNESTSLLSSVFWIITGIIAIFAIINFFIFLMYLFRFNLEKNNEIQNFFSNELAAFDIRITSSKMKKISFQINFIISNIMFFSLWIAIILISFLELGGIMGLVEKNSELIQWNLLWINYLVLFLLPILFNILFFVVRASYIKKKVSYEISDQELIDNFLKFKNDWISKNGTSYISVPSMNSNSWYLNLTFSNNNPRNLARSLKLHRRFPKSYDYWCFEGFKRYLGTYYKFLQSKIKISPKDRNLFFQEQKVDLNKETLKTIMIHNFISTMDSVDKKIMKKRRKG